MPGAILQVNFKLSVPAPDYERAATLSVEPARLFYNAADAAWLAGQPERAIGLLDEARLHAEDLSLTISIEHLRGQIALEGGSASEQLEREHPQRIDVGAPVGFFPKHLLGSQVSGVGEPVGANS